MRSKLRSELKYKVGTLKLERQRQKAKQKEFYDSFVEDYDDFELWKINGKENRHRQRFILRRAATMAKLAHLNSNSVILEVGCGTGNYTAYWLDLPMRICCLDLSRGMIRKAASKTDSDKLMLIQADAEHLPFKDSCFDAVLSVNTLEHLDDIPQALREMKRVVKSGGRIVISTPNENPMQHNLARLYNKCVGFFLTEHAFRPNQYGNGLTHQSLTANELLSHFRKCEIGVEDQLFMGFIERKMSQIIWAHGFMEVLERILEKIPVVKSLAGVIIICGTSTKNKLR